MELFNQALKFLSDNPEIAALAGGALIELITRKIPGAITFLHAISKLLDLLPGLKNKK